MKELLAKLCELDCIAGYEEEVRSFIEGEVRPYADEMIVDAIGNLIVFKKGAKRRVRPMAVTAHMDEVGFYVTKITEGGMIKFEMTGGMDPRILIGKKMRVGLKKVPGIISLKAIHLVSFEEEKNAPPVKSLYIDIGASSKGQAEGLVRVGEPIYFDVKSADVGDCLKAKGIDDRVGCAMMIELLKTDLEYDTWFVFNTNEEIGCRGSQLAFQRIMPGIVLALEGSPAADVPGIAEHKRSCIMRNGPAMPILDRGTVYNRPLREKMGKAADAAGIKWQLCYTVAGSTDARTASMAGTGALAIGIEIPSRYIHAPSNMVYMPDVEEGLKLAALIIREVGDCNV